MFFDRRRPQPQPQTKREPTLREILSTFEKTKDELLGLIDRRNRDLVKVDNENKANDKRLADAKAAHESKAKALAVSADLHRKEIEEAARSIQAIDKILGK